MAVKESLRGSCFHPCDAVAGRTWLWLDHAGDARCVARSAGPRFELRCADRLDAVRGNGLQVATGQRGLTLGEALGGTKDLDEAAIGVILPRQMLTEHWQFARR